MVGIQRTILFRKLDSSRQRIDDLSPSKFKVTSFKFGAEDDSMLSTSSLLDKSSVMLSDEPFDSAVHIIDESRSDDDGKVFRDRNREEVNTVPSSPSRVTLTPAGIPVYDSDLLDDNPVEVATVFTSPKSFLHGMVIIDEEEVPKNIKHEHVQVTPTPKKRTVHQGKLFESSPLTPPTDEDEKVQGLSLLDESLNYSNNGTPLPSPTRRFMVKNDPSTFVSSPITNELDNSLLQFSISSFIKNDETSFLKNDESSMQTADRELLFDSDIKKENEEPPMKTLYVDTKLDMKKSIHFTAAFSERAKPLLTFDEGERDDELDYADENSSELGSDTGLKHKKKQQQSSKEDVLKASLSPTGVIDFFQEDVISSVPSPPSPPVAPDLSSSSSSLKTNFMTHLLDTALNGCKPCSTAVYTKTKKQQQPDSPAVEKPRIPVPPSMKRPNIVHLVYSPAQSPAQELSMARKNANNTQPSLRRRDMKHVPKFLQTVEGRGRL